MKKIETVKEFFDNYFNDYDKTKIIDDEFIVAVKDNTKIILQGIKEAIGDRQLPAGLACGLVTPPSRIRDDS